MKFLSQINVNTEYALPIVDGTNGQVLTTDGSGAVYWGSVSVGALNLDGLSDVVITSPASGQILRYGIPAGSEDPNPVWHNWTPNFVTTANAVTITGTQTITGAKTFTAATTMSIASSSDVALTITKGGNGEGLIVNKTSGTGNAVTITGTLQATTIVKTGGTASQFLKADGSVDTNTYLTAHPAIANGGSVNNSNGTVVQDITVDANGHVTAIGSVDLDTRYYTENEIAGIFGGEIPMAGYNLSNWDTAYADKINSASFNTTNGILTLTQQDGGTVTVDLDGRYLTSETDSQTLSWLAETKELTISNGNSVTLDGLATEGFVTGQGYITSYTETDTLDSVTDRGATTTNAITVGGLTVDTNTLYVDATNNRVGIGTTSPAQKLDVVGSAQVSGQFAQGVNVADKIANYGAEFRSSSASAQIFFGRSDTSVGSGAIGADASYVFSVWNTPSFSRPFVITQGGNVGVGTTSPRAGEGTPLTIQSSTGYVGISLSGTGSYANVWQLYASGDGASNKFFGIYDRTNGAYRLVTTSAGNVGIGTTSPNIYSISNATTTLSIQATGTNQGSLLDISATGTGFSGINIGNSTIRRSFIGTLDGSNFVIYTNPTNTGTSVDERMRITSAGNVGIGTASPSTALHVNGVITATGGNSTNWNTAYGWGNHASAGYLTSYQNNYISDVRLSESTLEFTGQGSAFTGNIDLSTLPFQPAGSYLTAEADTLDTVTARGATSNRAIRIVGGSDTFQFAMKLAKASYADTGGHTTLIGLGCENAAWSRSAIGHTRTTSYDAGYLGFYVSNNSSNSTELLQSDLRMMINRDGNVGIGTTSPSNKLHVVGAASADAANIRIDSTNEYGGLVINENTTFRTILGYGNAGNIFSNAQTDSTALRGANYLHLGASSAATITINGSNDYVGIGTTSPESKLHVASGDVLISNGQYYTAESTTGGNYKLAGLTSGNVIVIGAIDYTSAGTIFAGGDSVSITTGGVAGSARVYINSSGNVGIGTTTPGSKLTVAGSAIAISNGWTGAHDILFVGGSPNSTGAASQTAARIRSTASAPGGAATGDLMFTVNRGDSFVDAIYINPNGNVGIGTTAPDQLLVVSNSTANAESGIIIRNSHANTSADASLRIDGYAGSFIDFYRNAGLRWRFNRVAFSDDFKISASGAGGVGDVMYFDYDTGNIGIGTTSPTEKFEVNGTIFINGDGDFLFDGLSGGDGFQMDYYNGQMYFGNKAGTTWHMVMKDNGNVGIGTTGPNNKLDVRRGGSGIVAEFHSTAGTSDEYVDIKLISGNTTAGNYGTILRHQRVGTGGADFAVLTNPTLTGTPVERFRITRDGNVGIGTTAPSGKLHVVGLSYLDKNTASAEPNIRLRTATDSYGTEWGVGYPPNSTDFAIRRANAGGWQERFRITDGGNVGIGTTSPSARLHINTSSGDGLKISTADVATIKMGSTTGGTSHWGFATTNLVASDFGIYQSNSVGGDPITAGTPRLYFNSSGNVGIGTASPSTKLDVSGVITATGGNSTNWNTAYGWGNHATAGYFKLDSVEPITIQAETVTFTGSVTIEGTLTESSSIRFKENIEPLQPSLEAVNALNPVSYNKIGEDNREIGLIAEDVAELFPEVVTYNEEGQPQGIQYQRLSVILLKAVQELTERVNKLENK